MKNNGFYLCEAGGTAWLLMRGDRADGRTSSDISDKAPDSISTSASGSVSGHGSAGVSDSIREEYIYPVRLNESGAYIWKQLDRGCTLEDVAVSVHERYGISYDEALGDVRSLANDFISKGYVIP